MHETIEALRQLTLFRLNIVTFIPGLSGFQGTGPVDDQTATRACTGGFSAEASRKHAGLESASARLVTGVAYPRQVFSACFVAPSIGTAFDIATRNRVTDPEPGTTEINAESGCPNGNRSDIQLIYDKWVTNSDSRR